MSTKSATVKVNFTKGDTSFAKTFSKLRIDHIEDKDDAAGFIAQYKGIVDGTPTTYDFSVVEAGIEV